MQSILKAIRHIEDIFMGAAGLMALLLVCFDVVTRYLFPAYMLDWTGEVTIYLTASAMLLGGGLLVQENRHIRADLFTRLLPTQARRFFEIIAIFAGLGFCILVAWYGIKAVEFSKMLDVRSESSIQFPLWIFYLCLPIVFGLMTVRYLHRLYLVLACFEPTLLEADGHDQLPEN